MSLLDMAATNYDQILVDGRLAPGGSLVFPDDFVVAHFDHGIRGEASRQDADFVRRRCRDYGVACRIGQGNLPANCAEARARQARYQFLNQVVDEVRRQSPDEPVYLVTAHHQDDLIETAAMNLIRGTGWRGLAPLLDGVVRHPLINCSKADLSAYAVDRRLTWVEDQTNYSFNYFRNRVRHWLVGCPVAKRARLLGLIEQQRKLRPILDRLIDDYLAGHAHHVGATWRMHRYDLIMLPADVAGEVLRRLTGARLTRPQLAELLLFVKTARPGKRKIWRQVTVTVDRTIAVIALVDATSGRPGD